MKIEKIKVKNFRCFKQELFEFSPHLNLILGPNTSGKSSLIESLYLLLQARLMRGGRYSHLIRRGERSAFLSGVLKEGGEIEVHLEEKGAIFLFKREIVPKNFFRDKFKTILFQADDISLISGEPRKRREFVDRVLIWLFPHYRFLIYEYKRLLRQRNAFLKESQTLELKYLEALEEKMAHLASKIIKRREEIIRRINPFFTSLSHQLDLGRVEIVYQEESYDLKEEELKERLKIEFEKSRKKDREVGGTCCGPQAHDIKIVKDTYEARFATSRGEQRLLSLALNLSLAFLLKGYGEEQLILLDDPFSELDEGKEELLFSTLTQFNQVIFTALPSKSFLNKDLNVIKLSRG